MQIKMIKPSLTVFCIFAITIRVVLASPEISNSKGWNDLLVSNGKELFDDALNGTQTKSTHDVAVLEEFKHLLDQDTVLENVYRNYRSLYKDAQHDTPLRPELFKNKLLKIAAHNLEANSGKHSWWMGVNQFTDLTETELVQQTLPETYEKVNVSDPYTPSGVTHPPSLDLVAQAHVSPAKIGNGGGPGAYFATVDVIETMASIKSRWPRGIPFSVQQLKDCLPQWCANAGCKGNNIVNSLEYISSACLYAWAEYPYNYPPSVGTCQVKHKLACLNPAKPFGVFTGNDDEKLKEMVVMGGGGIIPIHISNEMSANYGKGVYPGTECGTHGANRAVALVGYGTEAGKDYWLFKNSWGSLWGEQGFFKLARNGSSVCRVLDTAYWISIGWRAA